ncbi:MAG: TonB-dependent receptor [Gammaproteobacteria bacterium]|nr:TonB-dependent receptor [Gammaproteobacteria bacterium]
MIRTDSELSGTLLLNRSVWLTLVFLSLWQSIFPLMAEEQNLTADLSDLKGLSIQELLEVPVTSVSRRPQRYSDAAAALFVISQDDIRRSGASNIPELLRMVPGLQVARIDANKWAISARGFNGRYSNKLLVQQDGRTLYTPLYSGVYWDVQDTLLDDIDRIEVIRGPGATMWGANAVNGIINIITRSAHDTAGGLVKLAGGNEEALAALRYANAVGDAASFRLYAKAFERDRASYFSGETAADDWRDRRIGFRADVDLSQSDSLTLQGDLYDGESGASIIEARVLSEVESNTSGGNLLTRWTRRLASDAGLELQFYYDRTRRSNWTLKEDRITYDLDFQHHFSVANQHSLVWGFNYHRTGDDIANMPDAPLTFDPVQRDAMTYSAFIQDDIALFDNDLHLIIGSKFEYNDYTGWEMQPNIRAIWNLSKATSLWAAISRAVRTPSRLDSDVTISEWPVLIYGNPELSSERLIAYEMGLRSQPHDYLSVDLATFYNDYERLQTFEMSGTSYSLPIVQTLDNKMSGHAYGLELAANWDFSEDWRFKLAYAWFELDLDTETGSTDTVSADLWDRAPQHQLSLRSLMDLRHDLELDTSLFYVDELSNLDISSYLSLNLRLAWHLTPEMELSFIGKNLLDDKHPEFAEFSGSAARQGLVSTQVERSFLVQAKWRY